MTLSALIAQLTTAHHVSPAAMNSAMLASLASTLRTMEKSALTQLARSTSVTLASLRGRSSAKNAHLGSF